MKNAETPFVAGVWAKLRSITRLCSADNFSVSSTPLRAGGNTFDDSPTTSRTNDVDKGDVNKVSFSRCVMDGSMVCLVVYYRSSVLNAPHLVASITRSRKTHPLGSLRSS